MNTDVALLPLSSAAGEHASYSWKNVVITVWFGASTLAGLATHDAKLEELCARHPQGISTINVVLRGRFALPTPEVREELSRFAQKYAARVVASAMVLLGTGFWASAVRGAVTAVTLVSRRDQKPHIFAAPQQAAEWLCPIHQERTGITLDPNELLAALERAERENA